MSTIEDADKIDAIGIDKSTGMVILKIFDHLDWSNESKHLYLLQEKLNGYIRLFESKEIYKAYPVAKSHEIAVSIDFAIAPPANALTFIDTASKIMQEAGLTLSFTVDGIEPQT